VIKQWIHGNSIATIFNLISSINEFDKWLRLIAVNNILAPVHLCLCEQVIHLQCLLLLSEYVNNDTNKHVKDKQMEEEDDYNEENY